MQDLQLAGNTIILSALSSYYVYIEILNIMHFNVISNFLEASVNGNLTCSIKTLNSTCEAAYYNNASLFSMH